MTVTNADDSSLTNGFSQEGSKFYVDPENTALNVKIHHYFKVTMKAKAGNSMGVVKMIHVSFKNLCEDETVKVSSDKSSNTVVEVIPKSPLPNLMM